MEDCTDKIIALQQQRPGGISSFSLLRFSFMQDVAEDEERIVVKVYYFNKPMHAFLRKNFYDFVTENTKQTNRGVSF